MKIAIDISQLSYRNTGVSKYLEQLIMEMTKNTGHEYILFFSSLRRSLPESMHEVLKRENVILKKAIIPPSILHYLWNVLHKIPIEFFVGNVDFVLTSDWTEPPVRNAKKGTILYDLIIFKNPEETHKKIIDVQKKKLRWVGRESDLVFCISQSTKKDALEILKIDQEKLEVIYPGFI